MEQIIELADAEEARLVFGSRDVNLKLVRDNFGVRIVARNSIVKLEGDKAAVDQACAAIDQMIDLARQHGRLYKTDVQQLLNGEANGLPKPNGKTGWLVEPRSDGQRAYMRAIDEHAVTFCVGPAGTGKTFLAVAMAVAALRTDRVKKIVLVRPVVEAGEKLGYLPGDVQAKVNPYIRPLYDALNAFIEFTQIKKFIERDLIEIAPLAYMRGRTLNDAFVILDEAQNTSGGQMKMFLTRLGNDSKMVITGDVTQIDLSDKTTSGLVTILRLLKKVEGISITSLDATDIVRHPIVKRIVDAYDRAAKRSGSEE